MKEKTTKIVNAVKGEFPYTEQVTYHKTYDFLRRLTKVVFKGKTYAFSPDMKLVYMYLLGWKQNNDEVYPSLRRIMADCGIGSNTTILKIIHKLEDRGFLVLKRTGESKRTKFTYELKILKPMDYGKIVNLDSLNDL